MRLDPHTNYCGPQFIKGRIGGTDMDPRQSHTPHRMCIGIEHDFTHATTPRSGTGTGTRTGTGTGTRPGTRGRIEAVVHPRRGSSIGRRRRCRVRIIVGIEPGHGD